MDNSKQSSSPLALVVVVFLLLAAVAVGAFFLLQGNDGEETEADRDAQDDSITINIVETAQNEENLSTLVSAVTAAELVDTLSDETASFTVFAPTNEAFAEIQETVDTLLEPENQEDLQNVLQYHVVPSEVLSSDLTDGQMVETLAGEMLEVRIAGGNVYINDAMVVTPDVRTTNGTVHVIDKVLVPGGFENVVGTAQATDSLSTLVTAVIEADLVDTLSDESANYTVFAPTNDAFAEIQDTVDVLLSREDKSGLVELLTYHVVDSEVFSSELQDGQTIETLLGEIVTVEIEGGNVYIVAENSRAMVVTPDVVTSNGIVHVVDTVLLP